jgi:hypothetical protein
MFTTGGTYIYHDAMKTEIPLIDTVGRNGRQHSGDDKQITLRARDLRDKLAGAGLFDTLAPSIPLPTNRPGQQSSALGNYYAA